MQENPMILNGFAFNGLKIHSTRITMPCTQELVNFMLEHSADFYDKLSAKSTTRYDAERVHTSIEPIYVNTFFCMLCVSLGEEVEKCKSSEELQIDPDFIRELVKII